MLHQLIMIVVCLLVGGASFGVTVWFFRRLHAIEEESWGPQGSESFRGHLRDTLTRAKTRFFRNNVRKNRS